MLIGRDDLARWADVLRQLEPRDVMGLAGSALLFAMLWWPFAAAAVAGGWSVFTKAGRPGWTSLVPCYNALQFLRIARVPSWWLVLLLVPGVNVVVYARTCLAMARVFGQSPRFARGLFLAPPLFVAMLGLGPSRYRRYDVVTGEGAGAPAPAAGARRGLASVR